MTDRGRTSGRARSHCRAKVRTSRLAADGICRAQNFSSLQGPAGERRAICRYTHAAAIAIAVDIGSGTPGLPRAMPAECGAEPRRCRLSSGTVDSRATSTERLPVDGTNIGTRPHIPPWQRDDSSVDSGPSHRGSAVPQKKKILSPALQLQSTERVRTSTFFNVSLTHVYIYSQDRETELPFPT